MGELEALIVELTTRPKAELLMSIKTEADILMHDCRLSRVHNWYLTVTGPGPNDVFRGGGKFLTIPYFFDNTKYFFQFFLVQKCRFPGSPGPKNVNFHGLYLSNHI